MKTVVLMLALVALACAEWKTYESYQQVEVVPQTHQQVRALREWMLEDQIDFWLEPRGVDKPVHILVPPGQKAAIFNRLAGLQLSVNILDENIGKAVEEERSRLAAKPRAVDLDDFNTYEDIMDWMFDLAADCAAQGLDCEVYNAGDSYEGRPLQVFRMTGSSEENPPVFYTDATIHAREWLAPATLINIMDHMVNSYGSDPLVQFLVDSYEWYFLPVNNPDGYTYTFSDERMWRKNRRPNTDVGSSCIGTDLNRNFDFRWCLEGASSNPCSDTYCGSSGGSEPEVAIVQTEALRLADRIANYLTIHTYGYMWMFPYGNTINYNGAVCERADDHDDLAVVAEQAAEAIGATHGTNWAHGTSCEVIYATTGSTEDWTKGGANIKYGICAELRGNSFIAPPSDIQPSFEEVWNGIVATEEAIRNSS